MISPEFKEHLMTALKTAVDNFNHGSDPSTSVAKSAQAHELNVEQTRRLHETFNNARTLYHFNTNKGEKQATFPLADWDTVVKQAFAVEAAPIEPPEPFDYSEYDQPEKSARAGRLLPLELPDIPPLASRNKMHSLDTSLDKQAERAVKVIHTNTRLVKNAHNDARLGELKADQLIEKLASEFIANDLYWDSTMKYARLLRCFDNLTEFDPVMDKLAQEMPEHLVPTSEDLAACGIVIDDTDLIGASTTLKEAKSLLEESAQLRAIAQDIEQETDSFKSAFSALAAATGDYPSQPATEGPFDDFFTPAVKSAAPPYDDGLADLINQTNLPTEDAEEEDTEEPPPQEVHLIMPRSASDSKEKDTSNSQNQNAGGNSLIAPITKGMGDASSKGVSEYLQSGIRAMGEGSRRENKDMTERLKNTQREIILQDLVTNDPVIGDADPETISNAYLSIMQISPEVSMNKEVVRSILRHAIHSIAISPYDAQAWTDLEKNIRQVSGNIPRPKDERTQVKPR